VIIVFLRPASPAFFQRDQRKKIKKQTLRLCLPSDPRPLLSDPQPPTIVFPQEPGILRNGGIRFEERFALGLRETDGRRKTDSLGRATTECTDLWSIFPHSSSFIQPPTSVPCSFSAANFLEICRFVRVGISLQFDIIVNILLMRSDRWPLFCRIIMRSL